MDVLRAFTVGTWDLLWQHPVEVLLLGVLLYITVHRRDLSSNQSYRSSSSSSSKRRQRESDVFPTISPEDLRISLRAVSMRVADVSGRVKDSLHSNASRLHESITGVGATHIESAPQPCGVGGGERDGGHGDKETCNGRLRRSALELLLLNQDMCLAVYSFLEATDIASLSCTCHMLVNIHDPEFIWQQLWMERYGRQLWKACVIVEARQRRGIRWNPSDNWGPPAQGWKLFFMEFEFGMLIDLCLVRVNISYVLFSRCFYSVCRLASGWRKYTGLVPAGVSGACPRRDYFCPATSWFQ